MRPKNCESNLVDLLKFMKRGGWQNWSQLRVASFQESGRGLYSKRSLAEGDLLIELPKTLLVTLNTIESDSRFTDHWKEVMSDETEVSFHALLALYLCWLKKDVSWRPYIDSLPQNFSNPYFCAKEELKFLEENLLEKIVKQHEDIKESFSALALFGIPLEDFKWAYFVVNTRGVYIDSRQTTRGFFKNVIRDSATIALAPYLDFFNHNDVAKSEVRVTRDTYSILTQSQYPRLQQLFISYGAHSNQKLLLEYGFFIPENQHDFVEVSMNDISTLIKLDPQLRATVIQRPKFQFIKDHSLSDQMFFDRSDGLSQNLAVVLQIVFVEKNVHNLRSISFGDGLDLDQVRPFGLKLLQMKKKQFGMLADGLGRLPELSGSGKMCRGLFEETAKYLSLCEKFLE